MCAFLKGGIYTAFASLVTKWVESISQLGSTNCLPSGFLILYTDVHSFGWLWNYCRVNLVFRNSV